MCSRPATRWGFNSYLSQYAGFAWSSRVQAGLQTRRADTSLGCLHTQAAVEDALKAVKAHHRFEQAALKVGHSWSSLTSAWLLY